MWDSPLNDIQNSPAALKKSRLNIFHCNPAKIGAKMSVPMRAFKQCIIWPDLTHYDGVKKNLAPNKDPKTANFWCSETWYSMFGDILQHYINVLGTTLSIHWNATDVSFQLV